MVAAIPQRFEERFRQRAFEKIVCHAAERSSFYKKQFAQYRIDPGRVCSPKDLGSFFTTSEDLLSHPPEEFLCDEPQLALETAGTSGRHKRLYFRYEEIERNARHGVFLGSMLGIEKSDRIICTFEYSFALPALLVQRTLPYIGVFGMVVGKVEPIEILERIPDYRFNVVFADVAWIVRFTELAQEKGIKFPIKLFLSGGDVLTENARAFIEGFWNAPMIMSYGSTEIAASLGMECRKKDGYHLNDFDFYVEIFDPDVNGYGEVVVTTLNRTTMPLIRYRTRDVAKFVADKCSCGLPSRRLSPLLGRTDEIVIFPGWNIHPKYFEDIFKELPEVSDDWQVAVLDKRGKAGLEFRIEFNNGHTSPREVSDHILRALENRYQDLWRDYTLKLFSIDFEYFPKGTLRKSRKLKRLVDERIS